MAGGQTVNTQKLGAAGSAYTQDGDELKAAGRKLETNISAEKVGKAWPDVATAYVEAIGKYRDAMTKCGEQAANLGDKMSQAAAAYENGESFNADAIASKGV